MGSGAGGGGGGGGGGTNGRHPARPTQIIKKNGHAMTPPKYRLLALFVDEDCCTSSIFDIIVNYSIKDMAADCPLYCS